MLCADSVVTRLNAQVIRRSTSLTRLSAARGLLIARFPGGVSRMSHAQSLSRSWARLILALGLISPAAAAPPQDPALIPDSSIPIPALEVDRSGALVIHPSPTSSRHDF